MQCQCGDYLRVAFTDENKTTMVCLNPQCPHYAGEDLNNPTKIAHEITHSKEQIHGKVYFNAL